MRPNNFNDLLLIYFLGVGYLGFGCLGSDLINLSPSDGLWAGVGLGVGFLSGIIIITLSLTLVYVYGTYIPYINCRLVNVYKCLLLDRDSGVIHFYLNQIYANLI